MSKKPIDGSHFAKPIRVELERNRMEEGALEQAGAHLVLPGASEDKVNVLLKKGTASDVVDALVAEVKGVGNARRALDVGPGENIDLGELGEWRSFEVTLDPTQATRASGEPLRLSIMSKAAKGVEAGTAFYASLDLALAMQVAFSGDQLLVRPVEEGERDGQIFAGADAGLRTYLELLIGPVDDVISTQVMQQANQALQARDNVASSSGFHSALLALGATPQRPAVPHPDVAPDAVESDGQTVSEDTAEYLKKQGLKVPEQVDVAWAEMALDSLGAATPDNVAVELRDLYIKLQDGQAEVADDLFGDFLEEADTSKPSTVQAGVSQLAQSRAYKTAQLVEGLAGLEVDDKQIRKTADVVARALRPSKRPGVLIVAGPRNSAADRIVDFALDMVGGDPVVLGREDLATHHFPGVYGALKGGVPTGPDALLSKEVLDGHRETSARHVAVYVESLGDVGSAHPDEQEALQNDWLERVSEMTRSGEVNAYSKYRGGGSSESRTVKLNNVVFVMRFDGDAAQLEKMLSKNPDLAALTGSVVNIKKPSAKAQVTFLEQELNFRLAEAGLSQRVAANFSPELRADLESAAKVLGNDRFMERFTDRLFNDAMEVLNQAPLEGVEISWSRQLTGGERTKLAKGQDVAFATKLFSLKPSDDAEFPELTFTSRWEDVVQAANRLPEVERELNILRARTATAKGSTDTV